jgi:hypothetical protein
MGGRPSGARAVGHEIELAARALFGFGVGALDRTADIA